MAIIIGNSSLSKVGRASFKSDNTQSEATVRKIMFNGIVIWEKENGTMRKNCLFGNWKMNLTLQESLELVKQLKRLIDQNIIEVALAPSLVNLSGVNDALDGTNIKLIAQDVSSEISGAYTGQVSARQLAAVGVEYVFINHSEVRSYIYNSDMDNFDLAECTLGNKKIQQCLQCGLTPIVFIGDSLSVHQSGTYLEYLRKQLKALLSDISHDDLMKCIICYEPIWAIGTGATCTSVQAQEITDALREYISMDFSKIAADNMRILYGGSVNVGNAAELNAKPNIDGFVAGGVSLKPEFATVLQKME